MNERVIAKWVAGVTLVGLLVASPFAFRHKAADGASNDPAHLVANLDFTLKDMNGKDVRLSDFKGHPMLLNFWATWCGPCKEEIPTLVALNEKYKGQGLVILGVSIDDTPQELQKFAAEQKMTYGVLVGSGHDDLLEAYDAGDSVPISWFIRKDGHISERHQALGSLDYFDAQIRALL